MCAVVVSVLASYTQGRGFNPSRSQTFYLSDKKSFRGNVKCWPRAGAMSRTP